MNRNLAIVGVVALFGSVVCFQQLRAQQTQTPPPNFGGTATPPAQTTTPDKPTDKPVAAKPIRYEYKIEEVCNYINPASSTTLLSDLNDGGWEINAVIPEASDLLPSTGNGNGGVVINTNTRTVHYTQIVLRRPKQ